MLTSGNRRLMSLLLLLLPSLFTFCTRTSSPVPPPPRVTQAVTIRVITPRALLSPLHALSPTPSPTPLPLTPVGHLPFIGQSGPLPTRVAPVPLVEQAAEARTPTPAPTPLPTPAPVPPTLSPTPSSAPPTPSPTPLPVPTQRTGFPLVYGSSSGISSETLKETDADVALVVDASAPAAAPLKPGSTRTRWQAMRQALETALRNLPPDTSVALQVVGGRSPRPTCEENTAAALTFTPASEVSLSRVLDPLQPQGPSPLAEALLQAADLFPPAVRRPLVLLTTGGATCGEDPCAIARVLERAEVDGSVHVVAVGVSPEQEPAVRCIAEASGGTFQAVEEPDDLLSAVRTALRHALGGQLRVEVTGAEGRPLFPGIIVGGGTTLVSTFNAWTDADLEPGVYSVTVGSPIPALFEEVTIAADRRTRVRLSLGELQVTLVDSAGRPLSGDIELYRGEEAPFFGIMGEEFVIPLPTGHYTVAARIPGVAGALAYARDVPVEVGDVTHRTLILGVGTLTVTLRAGETAQTGYVEVTPVDMPWEPIAAGWATNQVRFLLTAGTYRLRVSEYAMVGVHMDVEDVVVAGGDEVAWELDLNTGTLTVLSEAEDGTPLEGTVTLFPAGDPDHSLEEGPVGTAFTLPAGVYDVRVEASDGEVLWAWNVRVAAGETLTLRLLRPQATLTVWAVDRHGQPVPARLTLHPPDTVITTLMEGWSPARWVVSPGAYQVRATGYDPLASETFSTEFSLDAGESRTITLTIPFATLTVRPTNADEVTVAFYPSDNRADRLGEARGHTPQTRLRPGTYDLWITDVADPERGLWVEELTLADGEQRTITITFP